MAFPPGFLDELRARVPLGSLVGRRVKLIRRGRELAGLCPFHHEKTPSFYVVEDKGFFHCFGCGAHGDVIGFTMQADNLPFPEAVERLAGEAGLEGPKASPRGRGGAGRDPLRKALGKESPEPLLVEAGLLRRPDDGREPYDYFRDRITFPIGDR